MKLGVLADDLGPEEAGLIVPLDSVPVPERHPIQKYLGETLFCNYDGKFHTRFNLFVAQVFLLVVEDGKASLVVELLKALHSESAWVAHIVKLACFKTFQ